VDWQAEVYVNGKFLGSHKGGYDAFSFDVTDHLTEGPGGENELIVGVIDMTDRNQSHGKQNRSPGRWSYTSVSGIWQTVWLEPTGETYVSGMELVPDLQEKRLGIRLQIEGDAADRITAVAYSGESPVAAGSGVPGRTLFLEIRNPRCWSPDDPFLYNLTLNLLKDGEPVDAIHSYFAMRSIELGYENGIPRPLLNGKFIYQAGTLDQGYWPDGLYTAVTDEALKYDVQLHKDMGFNMVRKHVKVESQRWYYWCDRLGLLVWQDMPHKEAIDPESNTQWEHELREMILEHINAPSIIYWVIFNEMWGIYDTDRITDYVKKLDPDRLTGAQSGGEDKGGYIDTGAGDGLDHHTYGDDPARQVPVPEVSTNPFRFSAVGKYGGIECVVPGHSYGESTSRNQVGISEVSDLFQDMQMKFLPWIPKGLSATVFTQITDVETEQNGLWTYDRKVPKVEVEKIRRINERLIRSGAGQLKGQ
jgi:beta-galactosidase/beta-glucuronidase